MDNNLLIYGLITVIVVCFVLIIILGIKYKLSLEEERRGASIEDKTPESEDGTDIIIEKDPVIDEGECHTISRLLVYKRDKDIWICPFCETENELTRNTCCLCRNSKG